MKINRYISLHSLIEWADSTPSFVWGEGTSEASTVYPSNSVQVFATALLPYLDGSYDNPYSTTTPKEKLPQYFTTAVQVKNYVFEEFADRLMSVPYRGGEFYPLFNRNLNHNEAMMLILTQCLINKSQFFIQIEGYNFLKKIGLAAINYNPLYNLNETERTTTTYGQHITDQDRGARLRTDNFGNTQQTDNYGAQSGSEVLGTHSDDHSETQMNDVSNPKLKTRDSFGSQSNSHTEASYTDTHTSAAVVNTSGDAAAKDITTSKEHVDTVVREKSGTNVIIQDLIEKQLSVLDYNPVNEFFKTWANRVCLSVYK